MTKSRCFEAKTVEHFKKIPGHQLFKDRHYTRIFLKRKLINYTKNELQGINILKLRLPNGFKCCLNFFIVGMGTNVK